MYKIDICCCKSFTNQEYSSVHNHGTSRVPFWEKSLLFTTNYYQQICIAGNLVISVWSKNHFVILLQLVQVLHSTGKLYLVLGHFWYSLHTSENLGIIHNFQKKFTQEQNCSLFVQHTCLINDIKHFSNTHVMYKSKN